MRKVRINEDNSFSRMSFLREKLGCLTSRLYFYYREIRMKKERLGTESVLGSLPVSVEHLVCFLRSIGIQESALVGILQLGVVHLVGRMSAAQHQTKAVSGGKSVLAVSRRMSALQLAPLSPYVPAGWSIESDSYLLPEISGSIDIERICLGSIASVQNSLPGVLPASFLDAFLSLPNLIPQSWIGYTVVFGTPYRNASGNRYFRCLRYAEYHWFGWFCQPGEFDSAKHVAALYEA